MTISVDELSLGDLIDTAKAANIRRILLTDYATVEPKRIGGAMVLAPMITVVATAFDRKKKAIYRWDEKGESAQMVTITAGVGRGRNPGGRLAARKQEVHQVLREEGFEVDEGEWTPKSAEGFIASRKQIVGGTQTT